MSFEIIFAIASIVSILILGAALFLCLKKYSGSSNAFESKLEGKIDAISKSNSELRNELSNIVQGSIANMGKILSQTQQNGNAAIEERLKSFSLENEQKLENIRKTVETRLNNIQKENSAALESMRKTVDEKLQKTLEERISHSFELVSTRLEEVYKGLGEMQNLASGVGDLKKVLSNVKSRGIIGEIQLGAILREVLSAEQFDENVATKSGSSNRVEFAVKLPADSDGFIYLPIDSKFPGDTYAALCDAYDSGDRTSVEAARKQLRTTLMQEAKDISSKYIDPPNTTDFAIMFLPFEGLYAEVVNIGLVEELQSKYRVNISGPSTMAALLNSLQMGFRTLAVQKQSTEVWKILEEVRNEFNTFAKALSDAQDKIRRADDDIEKLIGTRTRQMKRRLEKITTLEGYGKSIEAKK